MSENANLSYDDLEPFNAYVDEEGLIDIQGIKFKPSQILYTMDEIAYKGAYEEYKSTMFQENVSTIYSEFPSHIAVSFRKLYNGNNIAARERLDFIIDCSESIINFLFFLIISELRSRRVNINGLQYRNTDDIQNPDYKKIKSKDFFTDTFKLKIRILQSLIESSYLENNNCHSKQLNSNVLDALIELNQVRNDVSHSGTMSSEQYETKFQFAYDLLNTILPDLMFLKDCKILKFIKYENDNVLCTAYEGDSSVQKTTAFKLDNHNLTNVLRFGNDILFVRWDDLFIKLTPYLHFKTEYEGHDSIICTFKRLSGGNFIFEHSKTKSEIKFDELKGTFDIERNDVTSIINA
ncbi:hypothetical protein [Clostridium estertheticum]|uniref:Uncharacterized protein n=1 Tax=Clostridium estertheticum subsp. estertheticum TaxID=1552 RepID=A0A1J0GF74_9CLOT|nr:hypothetical protein [Clostridium estertheticum]APC39981.1 hypothetical protein A7L45_07840 [Clostridium estertheticum subsp. estertheticum]MBZ9613936.1 hypothetical protein [Clostridium estertheticum subsp. laramiense]WAG73897.1 hypothetical protein LL032_00075 [Clostridium estertheticum]